MSRPFHENPRKQFLAAGATGYIAVGLSYVVEVTPGRRAAFEWLPISWTPDTLGWIWVAAGIVSLVIVFGGHRLQQYQPAAFTLLSACPTLWAGVFIGATLTGAYPPGWISAILYLVMVIWTVIASGWDNPRTEGDVRTGEIPIKEKGVE